MPPFPSAIVGARSVDTNWCFEPMPPVAVDFDIRLAITLSGKPVLEGSTTTVPMNSTLPVTITATGRPGGEVDWYPDFFTGGIYSPISHYAFYLDFYKGTIFSDATLISGEQMNVDGPTLKSQSSVTFLGPGTYFAVLYNARQPRSDTSCPPNWTCRPSGLTLDDVRTVFETGHGIAVGSFSNLVGMVIFNVTADSCANGGCVSNVLFLPGIEASRLYYRGLFNVEHQVWEPDYHTDIPYLAMNANGTSKYSLYTKDIVDTIQAHNPLIGTIADLFGTNLDTYNGFKHFMDSLVASSTFGLKEWRAYPYDWRHDVRDIVRNGTPTEIDGTVKQVYLKDVVAEMASTSPTKRVTIVAHSNGGLLAKALATSLGDDVAALVDRIVTIGTPQWGTPSDIGVMLHGDGQTSGLGLITDGSEVRATARTMPGPYGLMPSPEYFSHVSDPVATFSAVGSPSSDFATTFGTGVTSFTTLADFITDSAGLDARAGTASDLRAPLPLSNALVSKASATHASLDAWTPPAGITFTAIAGWGQDTVKALAYTSRSKTVCKYLLFIKACADAPVLEHTPVTTQDGDGTVVSPSAVGSVGNGLYFDSKTFQEDQNGIVVHQNLTSARPIQNLLTDIFKNRNNDEAYIRITKPVNDTNQIMLRISSHSPVTMVVTDASGNQSGVLPIPGTDFFGVKRDIPGSSVQTFDDEEYINVPKTGRYQVVASGYAPGSATFRIDTVGGEGVIVTTTTFAHIPITASSTATFTVDADVSTAPDVDVNGDGTIDFTVVPATPESDPFAYAAYVKGAVATLPLSLVQKHEIAARLSEVEHQFKMKKPNTERALHILTALADYVESQWRLSVRADTHGRERGIPGDSAEIILAMIKEFKTLLNSYEITI